MYLNDNYIYIYLSLYLSSVLPFVHPFFHSVILETHLKLISSFSLYPYFVIYSFIILFSIVYLNLRMRYLIFVDKIDEITDYLMFTLQVLRY